MKKIVMITGATSGIGLSCAKTLAGAGYNLIICGRNKKILNQLEEELSISVNIHSLAFDVSTKSEIETAMNSLPANFRQIDVLINNAGNAHGLDSFENGSLDDFEKMININVLGVIYVTKFALPRLKRSANPHIINIGSVASKYTYPNGSVYCASKAAVDKLSEGMRMDFNPQGIKVSTIHPGLVQTDFSLVRFKGDKTKADNVYKGYQPLMPEDIAELIKYMIELPQHVNLADIVVLPKDQASSTIVNKKL